MLVWRTLIGWCRATAKADNDDAYGRHVPPWWCCCDVLASHLNVCRGCVERPSGFFYSCWLLMGFVVALGISTLMLTPLPGCVASSYVVLPLWGFLPSNGVGVIAFWSPDGHLK